jgi:hypothetical protein
MQKHVKTVKTSSNKNAYIYMLQNGTQQAFVIALTTARVAIRNVAIYAQYATLAQAERVARNLY